MIQARTGSQKACLFDLIKLQTEIAFTVSHRILLPLSYLHREPHFHFCPFLEYLSYTGALT